MKGDKRVLTKYGKVRVVKWVNLWVDIKIGPFKGGWVKTNACYKILAKLSSCSF